MYSAFTVELQSHVLCFIVEMQSLVLMYSAFTGEKRLWLWHGLEGGSTVYKSIIRRLSGA